MLGFENKLVKKQQQLTLHLYSGIWNKSPCKDGPAKKIVMQIIDDNEMILHFEQQLDGDACA